LPVSAEFYVFAQILHWPVVKGQYTAYFGQENCGPYTWLSHSRVRPRLWASKTHTRQALSFKNKN